MNPPLSPDALHTERERLLRPWPRLSLRSVAAVAAFIAVYAWGVAGTDARPAALVDGVPHIVDFVSRLFPPAWKTTTTPLHVGGYAWTAHVPEVLFAIVETVQMAIVGTSVAVVLAMPFALLAARNTSPHRYAYIATRLLLNAVRAIPEIVLALMFVAAVGLGPFAGVLALGFGAMGALAKLYAEAIEAIEPQQVQAVAATGASRAQVFVYGVIPQALPLIASYSLLVFETNVRQATILGIVGAGGVGFLLNRYIALFQFPHLMGAMLLIIVAVTGIDRLSDAIRKRLT